MYERTNLVIKPGEMTDERASEREGEWSSGEAKSGSDGNDGMIERDCGLIVCN